MLDCITDALIDSIKIIPYLFFTFIILEYIEHKFNKKSEKILAKNKKLGPILGGILGAFPQCGFSAMASNLYSNNVITMGTLIAIFLSTSDEMIPIMLSENINILLLIKIVLFKVIVGILVGYIVDIIYTKKKKNAVSVIKDMCCDKHCDCKNSGIFISSIKHTLKIMLFILFANIGINLIIFLLGEDNLSNLLIGKNILTYFISSLFGLIPNCASSVIITKLYLSNFLTMGCLLSGLLSGSGLGILLLFKSNKDFKNNLLIFLITYFTGVFIGILVDFII